VQYAPTSVARDQADAKRLLKWWRREWKIENCLHWVRDEQLRPSTEQRGIRPKAVVKDVEDASRIRTGDASQNLAAIRNSIISCFRIERIANIAATLREYAWNPRRRFAKLGRWIS
jgi:predicted transposase YbfD/YdcC